MLPPRLDVKVHDVDNDDDIVVEKSKLFSGFLVHSAFYQLVKMMCSIATIV